MTTLRVLTLSALMVAGSVYAAEPLKVTITAEVVGFPPGSLCQIDVTAEYRVVEPRFAAQDRGKMAPVSESASTFRVSALEKRDWDLETTSVKSTKKLQFTIPGNLPKAHPRAYSAIYVPVRYAVTVPGTPGTVEGDPVFKVRYDPDDGSEISRCLRLEVVDGKQLRVAVLPTCKHSFEDLKAQPLIEHEEGRTPAKRQ